VRLYRVAVPVSDIAAARAFYELVLGMAADDTVPTRLYFHCGGTILATVDWTVEGRGGMRPNIDHVYFATAELEAVHERATAAGARDVTPIQVQPWGERSFYCGDPDGNPLCFVDDTTLFLGQGAEWS